MLDAYIYDGIRTPFGRHAGALAAVRPDDLLAGTLATLRARSSFRGEDVEDVIIGCANQAGEDCRNVARRAGLLAGLPVEVAGMTVNRLCASGLAAVVDASRAIALGHPLGASGARLALTAIRQLERCQGRYALVTLCIGVGQGLAAVLERVC